MASLSERYIDNSEQNIDQWKENNGNYNVDLLRKHMVFIKEREYY